ncbi:RS-norcoclaurine 6-O-methyltransferase [Gossypium australe]|uniref:RS-norcoclaurine 6-O-methyltransferase n=1 Tax=Gossypium australe TaxID=47621 RepID=A0A5B6WP29_9ROSI|nr:RS-norcoclaurine 6-O-methyltransferase [Gossypium australe]
MERKELDEARIQGQAEISWYMFSFVDSMALKSVVELRIADIIHCHGVVITLSQIASCISDGLTSRDITTLVRIMRFLVRRKVFTVHHSSKEVEWKKILEGGSFSHYKIINIPDLLSIIEAKNEIPRELGERPNAMERIELDEARLQGQAEIWRYMFSFADSMALKSTVELRIADIIYSYGGAATLSQIASCINDGLTSLDITTLSHIMRLLVRKKIFTIHPPSDGGDPLYDLTHLLRWLLHNSEQTLAPMVLMENHPWQMAPWHYFSQCVKEGGVAFKKAHGCEIWDLASKNPDFNKLFNDGLACTSKVVTSVILLGYKQGFNSIGSLVDVGGGTEGLISEIVKAYPQIKVNTFDVWICFDNL